MQPEKVNSNSKSYTPFVPEDSKTSIAEDKQLYGTDFDDFGEDLFEVPKVALLTSGNPANPLSKTQALANTVALDQLLVEALDRYEWLKPPKGYVCHRCKIPGRAAFEMEMEVIVSTCDVSDLPELNCLLCKQVMKDAALTSKCCFCSFCDKLIMEYLVKISKKARILELKQINMKITVLTSYTPYPSRKIRRICACTSQKTTKG
uniref:Uncharacterized protein n=1 Tax=Tanacetum cinerariifolium TaxID=118510 RepID=A0A6L2MTB7_TANCI|nr:hypothetical protein [Tanacetum cinerariifolium]